MVRHRQRTYHMTYVYIMNKTVYLQPKPFSLVQRALKLATHLGVTSPYNPNSIRPISSPSAVISK